MPVMVDSRNWFPKVEAGRRRVLPGTQRKGVWIEYEGRLLLDFASNDYLGLSFDKDLQQAVWDTVREYGFGSGASRLVSGDHPLMHSLEKALAAWKGYEACLLVGSGSLANMGLIAALVGRHDFAFCDRLCHASLIDGVRLSGARLVRYPHLNLEFLQAQLAKHPKGRKIIVSDGVFSMDGDCADLQGLVRLAEEYDALLVVDDAHGNGVMGDEGKGLSDLANVAGHARLIETGTLGKAFGAYGAFILSTEEMIESLRQRLRTMIYSTALPPCVAAAALVALRKVREGHLQRKLFENIATFQAACKERGLPIRPSPSAIQVYPVGRDEAALERSVRLRKAGFWVPAIRPPTVPENTARLRISISALHRKEDLVALTEALT